MQTWGWPHCVCLMFPLDTPNSFRNMTDFGGTPNSFRNKTDFGRKIQLCEILTFFATGYLKFDPTLKTFESILSTSDELSIVTLFVSSTYASRNSSGSDRSAIYKFLAKAKKRPFKHLRTESHLTLTNREIIVLIRFDFQSTELVSKGKRLIQAT